MPVRDRIRFEPVAIPAASASFAPTLGGRSGNANSSASDQRERLGAAARRDAVSRFGLERMVDRYEACYRSVVAGRPVASISGENLSERP